MITVLFSGGQDSTTCLLLALAIARKAYRGEQWDPSADVQALTLHYGQRHVVEVQQAREICSTLAIKQHEVDVSFAFKGLSSSMLASGTPPPDGVGEGIAPTFVAGRNGLFIQLAAIWAAKSGSDSVMIGVNEVDFSGYPDCRKPFIESMCLALNLGFSPPIRLEAPLLPLDKKKIVQLAYEQLCTLRTDYGADIVTRVLGMSHTCYNGERPACGRCASCLIRKDGFDRAGMPDPAYNEQT